MDWFKSVATLKFKNDINTDKELKEVTGLSHPNLTSIRMGSAKVFTIEKLCKPFDLKMSTFISWGEK